MPDDISYPYRPSPMLLAAGVFAVAVPVWAGWLLVALPGGKLSSETWGYVAFFGLMEVWMIYLASPIAAASYFYWTRKTKITLRRSDVVLPVGITQRETAIRYPDIGYVEKILSARGSDVLSITVRNGER
jgi:hypothetical protein